MSAPASRARGNVSPRRPWASEPVFVPTLLPPVLSLHAPTPAIIAAAEARVIHLRIVIVCPLLSRVLAKAGRPTCRRQARSARKPVGHAGGNATAVHCRACRRTIERAPSPPPRARGGLP